MFFTDPREVKISISVFRIRVITCGIVLYPSSVGFVHTGFDVVYGPGLSYILRGSRRAPCDETGAVGRAGRLTAGGVGCDCRECDGTDLYCVPCELQLFPGFNSVTVQELMTGQS